MRVFFDLYGTLVDIRTDETSAAAWDALRSALSDCGVTYTGNAELQRRFKPLAQPIRDAAVAARTASGSSPICCRYTRRWRGVPE